MSDFFASDIVIPAVLIYLLYRAQNQAGFRKTETLLTRMIIFCVSTGALTSAFSITALVLNTISPTAFPFIRFFVCVSRCKWLFCRLWIGMSLYSVQILFPRRE